MVVLSCAVGWLDTKPPYDSLAASVDRASTREERFSYYAAPAFVVNPTEAVASND